MRPSSLQRRCLRAGRRPRGRGGRSTGSRSTCSARRRRIHPAVRDRTTSIGPTNPGGHPGRGSLDLGHARLVVRVLFATPGQPRSRRSLPRGYPLARARTGRGHRLVWMRRPACVVGLDRRDPCRAYRDRGPGGRVRRHRAAGRRVRGGSICSADPWRGANVSCGRHDRGGRCPDRGYRAAAA